MTAVGPHLLAVVLASGLVALYDPKEVGATDEVKRFFVAWDALFSKLPFKPVR